MREFIIVPILLILYFYAVTFSVNSGIFSAVQLGSEQQTEGSPAAISVGDTASVQVTRGYLFGLYRLPVFTSDLGDLSFYHNSFFVFVFLVTVFLIYRKIKLRNRSSWQRTIRL